MLDEEADRLLAEAAVVARDQDVGVPHRIDRRRHGHEAVREPRVQLHVPLVLDQLGLDVLDALLLQVEPQHGEVPARDLLANLGTSDGEHAHMRIHCDLRSRECLFRLAQ